MIEFDILTGTPIYTYTISPSMVVIPDGAIEFTPDYVGLNVISEEIRYDQDVEGIKWLTCELVKSGLGAKDGAYQVNLHVDYNSGDIIIDIPITIQMDREIEELEQSGTTSLKFVIDPLLSNQEFDMDYVLYGFNKEFNRYVPGLNLSGGFTSIQPGQFRSIVFQHQGVIPAGQYALEGYASDEDEVRFENKLLEISGYAMLIDFGDKSELVLVDLNSEINHSYEEDGFYTITVWVDFGGAIAVFTKIIEVRGPLVIADNDWNTWWETDPDEEVPHWLQVSF